MAEIVIIVGIGVAFVISALIADKQCEPIVIERDGDTYIYGHDIHHPIIVRKNGRMEW